MKFCSNLFGFDISVVRCLGGYFFLDTVYIYHGWPGRPTTDLSIKLG